MKKFILILSTVSLFVACSQEKPSSKKQATKPSITQEVKVYTTAKDSNKRLSLTETLAFHDADQPLETEVAVFENLAVKNIVTPPQKISCRYISTNTYTTNSVKSHS